MTVDRDSIVYVIDDDASVRSALKRLLALVGLDVEIYESVEEFLKVSRPEKPSCLILDVRLPGISGLDFQDVLNSKGMQLPIIFITAQGDIPMTRRAMKAGAVDFLTKPFRKKELLQGVQQALDRDRMRRATEAEISTLHSRLETLTSREREVLNFVVHGFLNKQIAVELSISEASVKFHRGHVMEKMQAKSVTDLVRTVEKLKSFVPRN